MAYLIRVAYKNQPSQVYPTNSHIGAKTLPMVEWKSDADTVTGNELVDSLFPKEKKKVVAVSYAGKVRDLALPINLADIASDAKAEHAPVLLIGYESDEGLEMMRHTSAHVMAAAIKKLFPKTRITIGPVIENGFYYDLDEVEIKNEDFKSIEKEMQKIIEARYPNIREEVSRAEALNRFADEPYKLELIQEFADDETISIYKMGDVFEDLCRGPHTPDTGFIKSFKLLKISGAFWRNDAKNKMLTRVYGTAFPSKDELNAYLEQLRWAEENDHNKLGRSLQLFTTHSAIGQGLPLLTGKGTALKMLLERMVEDEETRRGYQFTQTPYLARSELFKISGHWDHYQDGMFVLNEEDDVLALRPMTCPFHFCLYTSTKHSYRDLPVRFAENSVLFRNESSGEMHGLIRVRQFTLSDGHIVCRRDQVAEEFRECLELNRFYLKKLGFEQYWFRLSKCDPEDKVKYVDNPEAWESTERELKEILDDLKVDYVEAKGEAAFYGPKLDLQMKNVHGKEDTIMTIQIDFAMPSRFKMTYTNERDEEETPMVIHRSSLGCYERTIALLIEHYGGNFPFWMAPVQVMVLSINEKVHDYVKQIDQELKLHGVRSQVNNKSQSLGKKIRESVGEKIPVVVTVGEKEQDNKTISLRTRDGKVHNDYQLIDFIKQAVEASKGCEQMISL